MLSNFPYHKLVWLPHEVAFCLFLMLVLLELVFCIGNSIVVKLSYSLPPHKLQHSKLPCPLSPGIYSDSCPLSR